MYPYPFLKKKIFKIKAVAKNGDKIKAERGDIMKTLKNIGELLFKLGKHIAIHLFVDFLLEII